MTITYPGYSYQSDVESFGSWITQSSWLTAVGADYDVHTGTQWETVHLTGETAPASITDDQIQTYLAAKLDDGTLPSLGSADPGGSSATLTEPLYMIYYPASTTISDAPNDFSCQAFGGYHSHIVYHGKKLAYAVLPTCNWGYGELNTVTMAASHELIEAATDPYPPTTVINGAGYILINYSSPWTFIPGEVGDLCVGTNYVESSGYMVQRIWSNTAAAAVPHGSPCVPQASYAYFNVWSDVNDTQSVSPGQMVTYHLTAWSDRPLGESWSLSVVPYQGNFTPPFKLQTSRGGLSTQSNQPVSVQDGDTATLTFTIPAHATSGDYASFVLYSSASDSIDGNYNMFPVAMIVGQIPPF